MQRASPLASCVVEWKVLGLADFLRRPSSMSVTSETLDHGAVASQ